RQELELENQPAQPPKKRPAPPVVQDDRMISSSIPDRPSQFAINKIEAYEYIDLWYFTPEGRAEAAGQAKAPDGDGFSLEGGLNGERLALKSTTTASPSKNVILDEALPWHVFTESRYRYLKYIGVARWPEKLYKDMAAFFVRIETHPIHKTPAGKRALLEYQARARRDWH
ncbi:hypothetical protein BD779DRAFT_1411891, partial [Infundibulicybe gibba]